jgi:pyruvate/2-oxoglutarate dehydrogenase complex dihydrolipoamide dehydrogenase (E3) component
MQTYDAIVIGAGQGGGPLAGAFARAGRRTALVERAHVGGTCVNDGCSPTKTMVASARAAHVSRRASAYGVRRLLASARCPQCPTTHPASARAAVESDEGASPTSAPAAGT